MNSIISFDAQKKSKFEYNSESIVTLNNYYNSTMFNTAYEIRKN